MTPPWNLEDWLTEKGDDISRKRSLGQQLTEIETLVFEIWILDTEIRAGSLAQYFANRGMIQWNQCKRVAFIEKLPSFELFAIEVDSLILNQTNAYNAFVVTDHFS